MALRLGEVLIRSGLINEQQLNAALDAQLIYGGHLGTCLVELGFVHVDTLAEVLSKQFSVGRADRERILKIDPKVIGTLSTALVVKHEVIPFDLQQRVLHVAMVNPKNLLALDELSFASGYKVEAWVAPEILVHRAMEHYYNVPRKLRHITVSGAKMRTPSDTAAAPGVVDVPAPETEPAASEPTPTPEPMPEPIAEPTMEPAPESMAEPAPATDPEQANAPTVEPEEDDVDAEFVAQTRPKLHAQPKRDREATPAGGANGRLAIDWIKRRDGDDQHWCDLFRIPVSHEHFNDVAGVYVVWHNGHNPVLRVGQGYIRTELSTLKLDPRIRSIAAESPVYASWAQVQRALRDGVERYLIDMLGPQIVADVPDVEPVEVNLPC
jgi:hypothetical protein